MDDSTLILWNDHCLHDLSWWLDPVRLQEGASLAQVSPDLDFWFDASDVEWGSHLGREVVSSRWSLEEASPSINAWELLAVERGLLHFLSLIVGSTVSIFADNSMAVAYLRKSGGTRSAVLNTIAQRILCWVESHQIVLGPTVHHGSEQRFGRCSIPAQPNPGLGMDVEDGGVRGATQTLAGDDRPVHHLSKSPMLSLFLFLPRSSGSGDGCSSNQLGQSPRVCFPSLGPDSSGSPEAPVLLRSPDDLGGSVLASTSVVPGPSGSGSGSSDHPSSLSRSSQTATLPSSTSRGLQDIASCVETLQRFARAEGFSSRVAAQVGLAHRPLL